MPEFKYLEQELSLVYTAGEGRYFIVTDEHAAPQSLADLNREHRPVRVSFACGPRNTECRLEVGVFARPFFGASSSMESA